MRYEGTIYRPPSEAHSLLIQCTIGCPHNRCTFCGMYKDKQFRIRSVADIREDLTSAREYYGDTVRSLFLPDGNTILMKTAELVEILNYARELFPELSRITMYGSAQFLNLKTQAELSALRQAGLDRIHSGMESGDDVTLKNICKGSTAAEIISAGRKVIDAGMELSEYVLIGIGGLARSQEHALESARVLNAIRPDFIRLRTLIPMQGTPLHESYCSGESFSCCVHIRRCGKRNCSSRISRWRELRFLATTTPTMRGCMDDCRRKSRKCFRRSMN